MRDGHALLRYNGMGGKGWRREAKPWLYPGRHLHRRDQRQDDLGPGPAGARQRPGSARDQFRRRGFHRIARGDR